MMRRVRTRAGVFGFFAILCCSAVVAPTASAGTKPYSVVICEQFQIVSGQPNCTPTDPAVISPGATTSSPATLSVTFTNKNPLGTGIQLGSDNLTVPTTPTGFSILSTSLPPCPASVPQHGPACAYLFDGRGQVVSSGGTTVGFRNLSLIPGATTTITMSARTPPPLATACTTAAPCNWSDQAKQANDFSGSGNGLNADSTSAYGMVTSAAAPCLANETCSTTLADGGTPTGTAVSGTISATIDVSSGNTPVTLLQSLDFGPPLDPTKCSGVFSDHYEYGNLSNGTDNGADRTITTSITTTPFSGYQSEFCLETGKSFIQKVIPPSGLPYPAVANPVTQPDGSSGFQGLLPNCGAATERPTDPDDGPLTVDSDDESLTVNCAVYPGVKQRIANPDGTTTIVAVLPPGYDFKAGN